MALMNLSNPAPGRPVTSPYGPRRHPITGAANSKHRGIDYGGTFPVRAAADGVVVDVIRNLDKRSGYGHGLILQHAPNLFTVYAHGAAAPTLKKGARVARGQVLFTSGATGAATGPHLHFEVRTARAWGSDVNPAPYFAAPAPKPSPSPAPATPSSRTHTVQRGETLSAIARRYATNWQVLYNLNRAVIGPNPNRIVAGQVLALPGAPAPAKPAPAPAPAKPKPAPKPPAPRVHTVARGETLGSIAKRYGTTWRAIYAANRKTIGWNPNRIFPGQRLVIR